MRHHRPRQFKVLKASGRSEPFSRKKLFLSLERTGLPPRECQEISARVAREVGEGAETRDIFKKTLKLVKETSPLGAVNYSLKRSLFDLGPEGHHFETFVARYFAAIGFETETRNVLRGRFVRHEVDVIALKDGQASFCECKFHNHAGIKNDIKVALYVKARWDDLREGPDGARLRTFYVASNTSFSQDAITYATGTGLHLLGVNMPAGESFLDEIKKLKLYPLTSLRRLPKLYRKELLARDVVLARDVLGQRNLLLKLGLRDDEWPTLIREIDLLTGRN
jgi:hypothetical protein